MMVQSDLDVSIRDARCKCGQFCQGKRGIKDKGKRVNGNVCSCY